MCCAGQPFVLDQSQAMKVVRRFVMDGPLGVGRATLLKWLVEAGDRSKQDANAAQVKHCMKLSADKDGAVTCAAGCFTLKVA